MILTTRILKKVFIFESPRMYSCISCCPKMLRFTQSVSQSRVTQFFGDIFYFDLKLNNIALYRRLYFDKIFVFIFGTSFDYTFFICLFNWRFYHLIIVGELYCRLSLYISVSSSFCMFICLSECLFFY